MLTNGAIKTSMTGGPHGCPFLFLRVYSGINSQIFGVEAPGWQGGKTTEYQAYSMFFHHSQTGCIGAKNVKLFLSEPLVSPHVTTCSFVLGYTFVSQTNMRFFDFNKML